MDVRFANSPKIPVSGSDYAYRRILRPPLLGEFVSPGSGGIFLIMWPSVLNRLLQGERFSENESQSLMADVLAGNVSPVHLSAFLCLLRSRGETVDEVTGFLAAIREVGEVVPVDEELRLRLVDTCGTGGDRSSTINVSTTASFVVAGAGVPVAKHGNRASSSQSGAADVLEALNVPIELAPEQAARSIREAGIAFLLAPRYHPAFRHAGPVRKELGVPTIMNFLGPLSNPALVERQVIGVSNPAMAALIVEVLRNRGAQRAMVVHGLDGLDEVSVTSPTRVYELRNGEIFDYQITPDELGVPTADPASLVGGDPKHNADRVNAILGGETGSQADFVAVNAAAGLVVGGAVADLKEGVELAKKLLADGSAASVLEKFRTVNS